jgi:mutator family transposase
MADVRRLPVGEDNEGSISLDDLAREGARRMIAAALEAEVDEYVSSFVEEIDEDGKRLVVRNGRARERRVTVGAGTVPIRAPRVNDKRVDEETRGAQAVRLEDPACVRAAIADGDRGAPDPVSARALDRRLRARRSGICWARTRPACRPARSSG